MKKLLALLLALAAALALSGCTRGSGAPAPAAQPAAPAASASPAQPAPAAVPSAPAAPEPAKTPVWQYDVTTEETVTEYKTDDGVLLATVDYERPVLRLVDENGNAFSGTQPENGVTAEQLSVCRTFNDAAAKKPALWREMDIEAEAKESYAAMTAGGWDFLPFVDELKVAGVRQQGDLVSVYADAYVNLGGAHPDGGRYAWNFDLAKGEYFALEDLTDRPEKLRDAVTWEIIDQIVSNDRAEWYYEDFVERIRQTERFNAWFGADGLTVWFEEYEIAPHAVGVPEYVVPYAELAAFLNADGKRLLDLPAEDLAMGDFYEAQEMWSWFDGGAPQDDADRRTVRIDAEGGSFEMDYYRADVPGVTTLAQLRQKLATRFSDALIERLFTPAEYEAFREFDGVLYSLPMGRGDDMYIDSVECRAELDADGRGGKVIATIQWRDFDDSKGEWYLTEKTDTEFPFELTENGARFTEFRSIY